MQQMSCGTTGYLNAPLNEAENHPDGGKIRSWALVCQNIEEPSRPGVSDGENLALVSSHVK